jgi:lysophospholipase L1-like esterase
VVFIGDSITQGWEDAGKDVWARDYAPLHAVQIGVGGDRTEHLLWRLQQAPLTPLDPKVIVLMIGTNNAATGRDTGELIIRGVRAVTDLLHAQCPGARVLVLDIPPRGAQTNPLRGMVLQVNQALSQVDWPEGVRFVRVADSFAQPDGRIDPALMPDFLHFSPAGYEQWSEGIRPAVTSALRAARRTQAPTAVPTQVPAAAPAPADRPAANPAPRTGT